MGPTGSGKLNETRRPVATGSGTQMGIRGKQIVQHNTVTLAIDAMPTEDGVSIAGVFRQAADFRIVEFVGMQLRMRVCLIC